MLEGVDISHWNTVTDWGKVARTKRFAIVASGDGTYLDPRFGWNILGAHQAGMAVDIYHYLRFALTPQQQAEICLKRFLEAKALAPVKRLWLDWEDTSEHCNAMSVDMRCEWAERLLGLLSIPVGQYSARWWWNPYMGDLVLPGPFWVAQYGSQQPVLPQAWSDWAIWQYTSSGHVDGVAGNVDLNVAKPSIFEEDDMDEATVKGIVDKAMKPVLRHLELEYQKAKDMALFKAWQDSMGTSIPAEEDANFWAFINGPIKWRLLQHGWAVPE